jgi:hypothetical protein
MEMAAAVSALPGNFAIPHYCTVVSFMLLIG